MCCFDEAYKPHDRAALAQKTGVSLRPIGDLVRLSDLARKTVRRTGLTRFIALNLLIGYGWL